MTKANFFRFFSPFVLLFSLLRPVRVAGPGQTLTTEVVELFVFDSFASLYKELSLLECGYTVQDVDAASPSDMDAYYTKERQEKYGGGIKIKLL